MIRNSNKIIRSVIAISLSFSGYAQTDTPCGAPLLTVGTNCVNTTANITSSATNQTDAANGGSPSCGSMGEDVWYSFVAPASGNVLISFTSGTITDAVAGIYDGPCTAPTELVCNDDGGPGLMPQLSSTTLTPGNTYYIRLYDYGGGTGDVDLCITEPAPPPTNISCAIPDPICSGSPINFTAQANNTQASSVDPGNNYDCLISQPNPSWYYLKIANGGNLVIDVTAGSDVDFAIWGPYPDVATAVSNCGSYPLPVDCSFSATNIEQVNVAGVIAGEVYVLLVTNYANTVQTITVQDAAANTATTDCSIVVLPVELSEFRAERIENEIHLSWITLSEIDNDYFIVERSIDGQNWSAFDLIEGNGNSQEIIRYSSIDRNFSKEVNYYRLKQFDFNGKMSISEIVSVNPYGETVIQLFPNPAKTDFTILSNEEIKHLTLYRFDGNMIFENENCSTKKMTISTEGMTAGIYYVDITTNKGSKKERIIIQ